MGVFDALFGGSETKQLPGAQAYIDRLFNFDPTAYGLKLGLGQAGKWTKQDLQGYRAGKDIGSIPGIAGIVNAAKSSQAAGDKVRNRDLQFNTALSQHPELEAAQQAELQNQSNQDTSNLISGQTANWYNNSMDFLNNAFQSSQARRLAASGQKLQADQGALSGYLASFFQKQNPGILNQIGGAASSLAKGAAGAATAFGI